MRVLVLSMIVAALMAACASKPPPEKEVVQALAAPISSLCLEVNRKVRVKDMAQRLMHLIEKRGVDVRFYEETRPADCPRYATYTARKSWSGATYMSYAKIEVFEGGTLAGSATYDIRHDKPRGSAAGETYHFDSLGDKLSPMIEKLFPV